MSNWLACNSAVNGKQSECTWSEALTVVPSVAE